MGYIVQKELPQLNPTSIYACQEAVWMDERCMLIWVDQILGPYLVMNPPPPGVQLVILLDSYQSHLMALVVSKISALGVEVIHIPGGCTGLCQPLDVGINRPFKSRIQQLWEEWMMDMIEATNTVCNAMHEEVAEWVAAVYWDMVGSKVLKKAWQKTEYNWFPGLAHDNNNNNDGDDGNDDGNSYNSDNNREENDKDDIFSGNYDDNDDHAEVEGE